MLWAGQKDPGPPVAGKFLAFFLNKTNGREEKGGNREMTSPMKLGVMTITKPLSKKKVTSTK